MTRLSLCCLILLSLAKYSYGQGLYSISGTVKDTKGETLPGAGIYLSGYKIGTVADNNGKFSLNNLKPGNYDVLVQVIGFLPQNKNVIITNKSATIEVVLQENITQLQEVVIRADPERQYHLELFRKFFIGTTPHAKKCKILNPQVIITEYDKKNRILKVTANEFLIIENKALGYRIKYLLDYFENNQSSNIVFYSGHPYFEELKASKSKKKEYLKYRDIAYRGSPQHFFQSLYQNKTNEEGYIINKLIKIPNTNRPSDSVINAHINRILRPPANGGVVRIQVSADDSLAYWSKLKRQPKFINTLNRGNVLTDTLVKQIYPNLKTVNYSDALYVIYTREKETVEYTNLSGHSVSRPLDMPNYQISIVHQLEGPVNFFENGGIYDPRSLLYEGFWAYEKIADMVPLDYIPQSK
ncbi:carboxypeptidase-like regulatory domain-containing protein [Pedobacter metabolipauper]|uniref:Carboxypeptidase-like protein n=1 Tax=Pedobacter metabolipauper TaxID=425513 RepID=A0A4V3D0S8_9SPHI|nr:carboxypeptidase-like regulatory domain-containing protein [Pedobacter metabolipauper]TDQ07329.1 carboxypeptidase-like protein [Pedobacter metabolipauper]